MFDEKESYEDYREFYECESTAQFCKNCLNDLDLHASTCVLDKENDNEFCHPDCFKEYNIRTGKIKEILLF